MAKEATRKSYQIAHITTFIPSRSQTSWDGWGRIVKLVSIQVCSTFLGVNLWSQVTGGILSMTSWLEWWRQQSGDDWRQWKNGGVSGMEESIPWCWSSDMSIASVHRNTLKWTTAVRRESMFALHKNSHLMYPMPSRWEWWTNNNMPGSTLLQLTLTQLIYKKYLISHTAYNLQCMCQRRKSTFLEYLTKPQRLTEKKISVPATSEEMEDLDEVAASKEGKRCQGNSIGDAPPSKWSTLVGTQSVHY